MKRMSKGNRGIILFILHLMRKAESSFDPFKEMCAHFSLHFSFYISCRFLFFPIGNLPLLLATLEYKSVISI